MRRLRDAVAAALFLAAPVGDAAANPATIPVSEQVRAFLIEQHAPEIASSFGPLAVELAKAEPPPGVPSDWPARVERAFATPALIDTTQRHVEVRWEASRAEAFSRFQATPLGARVRAAEAEVLRADRAALDAFLAAQPLEPVTDERAALVRRLDRAQGSSELYVQATRAIRTGLQRAANASTPADGAEDDDLIATLADAGDRSLRARLRTASESTALFTFRIFSTAELAEYAAFCESPDAQWAFRILNDALLASVTEAAASLASSPPVQ